MPDAAISVEDMIQALAVCVVLTSAPAPADGYTADVRVSLYLQTYQRSLLPGPNDSAAGQETIAAVYKYAFARVTGVDLPWGKDALSAELSAYAAVGALPSPDGALLDGDLQGAWVQHQARWIRFKLGRQTTLPGAARYLRFDGVSAGVRLGPIDISGYVGAITLPRFGRPRGYFTLGNVADALADPSFLEWEARPGQWTAGALASWVGFPHARASVGFHEQRGALGVAFRNLSADALIAPVDFPAALGGRFVFDLHALAPAEARAWLDVTALEKLPLSLDYVYAAPALLLPHGSVLAAFGGASWHELGLEASYRPTPYFKLTGRAAGQLYPGSPLGGRFSVKAKYSPFIEGTWNLQGEYARVSAPENGYHHLRLSSRYFFAQGYATSVELGGYVYDLPVRGKQVSFTALTNVELPFGRHFRGLVSAQLASTPWAKFDAGFFARVVYELDAPSAGGAF